MLLYSLPILLLIGVLLLFAEAVLPAEYVDRSKVGAILYLSFFLRYVIISGLAFMIFFIWKRSNWRYKRIQKQYPEARSVHREYHYSLSTFAIFALIGIGVHEAYQLGYTRIYTEIAEYGKWYFVFSVLLALVVHDLYFYWTHRLMHWKPLFKMHRVHHLSHDPSPWAAFSFHPTEAVIEGGILPLLVFTLPMHPLAIATFLLIMTVMNVIGHLGHEVYPSGFTRHWLGKWNNTSTHHNMHHRYTRCNYGLYFNWWDALMRTNHVAYERRFEEIATRKRETDQKLDTQ